MRTITAIALAIATGTACATEHGLTSYPSGTDDFLLAAMPPPGVYGRAILNRYRAEGLRVDALALRLDWVKPVSILGADRWGTLVVLPLLDVDLSITPAPGVVLAGSRRGAGDVTIGNGLHWTFDHFHAVAAIDVVLPTAPYDANQLVNLGRNQWVVRLNQMGTWFPTEQWDISYRVHTDINFRNPDTDYRSGRTAFLEVAAGWKPTPATTIGVASYFFTQLSDDRQHGERVGPDGNRRSVRGLGPVAKHFFPNGVFVTASAYRESKARNGPQGTNVWLYAGLRF